MLKKEKKRKKKEKEKKNKKQYLKMSSGIDGNKQQLNFWLNIFS
jgi:hypothetical protein